MPEVFFTCLYCDNKWTYISFYVPKEKKETCSRCKETKMIKMEIVKDSIKKGNVFGYEEDSSDSDYDDGYRD